MRIVDIHVHVFPDALAPTAIPALAQEGRVKPYYDGTVGGLLASMDEAGVDMAVLQPVATKPSQVRSINDWSASVAGERVLPFGAMHPDLEDAGAELDRMLGLGIPGFKLHPEYQRCAPDDPRALRLLEAARDRGMRVLFHAGVDPAYEGVLGTPAAFARMLDAVPGLRAVLAHLGGYEMWDEVREHIVGREVWLDTAFAVGHMPDEVFVGMVRAHGADKVLFGTDGPWKDTRSEIERILALPFSDSEKARILGGNADAFLAPA